MFCLQEVNSEGENVQQMGETSDTINSVPITTYAEDLHTLERLAELISNVAE